MLMQVAIKSSCAPGSVGRAIRGERNSSVRGKIVAAIDDDGESSGRTTRSSSLIGPRQARLGGRRGATPQSLRLLANR